MTTSCPIIQSYSHCTWYFKTSYCQQLTKCIIAPGTISQKQFTTWQQCSSNCCSLTEMTYQGIQQCIQKANRDLALGLSLGFGYPMIAILVYVCYFNRLYNNRQNFARYVLFSLFWPLLIIAYPFLLFTNNLPLSQDQVYQAQRAAKQKKRYPERDQSTNQIVIVQENEEIKNQLRKIKQIVDLQRFMQTQLLKQNLSKRSNQNQSGNSQIMRREQPTQNCIVCLSQKREFIGQKCFHLCLCQACSKRVNGKCPICKKQTSWKKVFIS